MAKIINGSLISQKLLINVALEVEKLNRLGIEVCLAVVSVGFDYASKIYVNNKAKTCKNLKIKFKEFHLEEQVTFSELLELVNRLNSDKSVNGILIQLPLPPHIDAIKTTNLIDPTKDVDGFCYVNTGRMFLGKGVLLPCTPAGILYMLDYEGIDVCSKHCVIVGRSTIVGKPLSSLLMERQATVTVCCSKTLNLGKITQLADVLISAAGKANLVKASMVKPGAIVVDVGINRNFEGKICGDVDFDEVKCVAKAITPVPKGVGPLTIAKLMDNVVTAAKMQNGVD